MPAFEFTAELWPIVRAHFKGQQSDEDIDTYIQGLTDALGKKESYGLIMVMDEYANNFSHVRKLALFTKENFEETKKYLRGIVFVAEGRAFRFLLSTFSLITPLPCPYEIFPSEEEGLRWLHAQVEQ